MRIVECPDDCVENRGGETEATKEQLRFGDQRQRAATGANKTPAEGVEITLLFTRADIRLDIKPSIPLLDLLVARKQKNREDTPSDRVHFHPSSWRIEASNRPP